MSASLPILIEFSCQCFTNSGFLGIRNILILIKYSKFTTLGGTLVIKMVTHDLIAFRDSNCVFTNSQNKSKKKTYNYSRRTTKLQIGNKEKDR